ncbi:MAG: hypothetical protein AABY15_04075, partial [Nanoarchaeota archaeon]
MVFDFDKKALMKSNAFHLALILAFAIAVVFAMNFALADAYSVWGRNSALVINFTDATGVNVNEDVGVVYNFSLNNSIAAAAEGGILTIVNVSLWGNFIPANWLGFTGPNGTGMNLTSGVISNVSVGFTNTSDQLRWNNSVLTRPLIPGNITFTNASLWFNATAPTPGLYNISLRLFWNNSVTVYNETNITIRVNDTTRPHNVSVVTLGLNRGWVNQSGSLVLNISALDNGNFSLGNSIYTEISEINVTVYNISSTYNVSYNMSNSSSVNGPLNSLGNYWKATINTAGFPDGVYNISIFAKDRQGNVNSTNISNVRFDNTKPTASVVCSPAALKTGDVVTCTCSPSDPTSGINSSVTSITANPSTANTGTFTESCSFADMAGNTASTTAQYTVEQSGSGAASSAGATSSVQVPVTSTETESTKTEHTFEKITPGEAAIKSDFNP